MRRVRCGKKVVRGERECWPCASTGLREFLEGKARNLGDDVITHWLEVLPLALRQKQPLLEPCGRASAAMLFHQSVDG